MKRINTEKFILAALQVLLVVALIILISLLNGIF